MGIFILDNIPSEGFLKLPLLVITKPSKSFVHIFSLVSQWWCENNLIILTYKSEHL